MRLKTKQFWRRTTLGMVWLLGCALNHVQALPSGGQVAKGSGTIETQSGQLVLRQNSARLITHWNEFSIAAGERVLLLQPSGSAVCLARVVGGKPSEIYGSLSANGKLFLLNSNGILFGKGSSINTGGLVASTMQLSDQDFLADRYRFSGGQAGIVNQGLLQATEGGYVMLLAPSIANQGTISAQRGNVVLAAGGSIILALQDKGLIQVQVDSATLAANVTNSGRITANGGTVLLSAQSGGALLAGSVNHQGLIEAKRLDGQGGSIVLDSGAQGTTTVSGSLNASGANAKENGGQVSVLGGQILLKNGSQLDASGLSGGTLLVGGNRQGRGPERNAQQTTVESGASLTADATGAGNGGNVVVWSNGKTRYQGTISARGGADGGNGGQAEVSGKETLSYQGNVDLRAPKGRTGELLLDPKNIYIVATGTDPAGDLSFTDNNGGDTKISGAALGAALNSASIRLQADNDVQFLDNVTSTAHNTLNVESGRSIIFDNYAKLSLQGDAIFKINSEGAQAGNRNAGGAIFRMWEGTKLTTGNGNVQVLTGTFGGVQNGTFELKSGVTQPAPQIISGNGNIDVRTVSLNRTAVTIANGALLKTTNGFLSLDGTANGTVADLRGVLIAGTLQTTGGELKIKGTSNGNGALLENNNGVELDGATVSSQGGAMTITGIGGTGNGNKNVGVLVGGASSVSSDSLVAVNGTARATGISGHGVLVDNSQITLSGSGAVDITGAGGAGLNNNYGIQVKNNAAINSVNGNIGLHGSGGASSGDFNPGVVLSDNAALAASGSGSVLLEGTGGNAANENSGIYMKNASARVNSGTLQLTGDGKGIGQRNAGIWLDQNVDLRANSQGSIRLLGTGSASGSNNAGVRLQDLNLLGTGSFSMEATGGAAGSPDIDGSGGVLKSVADMSIAGKGGTSHRATLGQVQAGGKLTLGFDLMPAATQLYGANGVVLKPYTPGMAISLGSGSDGLVLLQADLDLLTLGAGKTLQLGSQQTGAVKVNAQLNQGSRNVTLQTGTDIELNAPLVTSGSLSLQGSAGANTFSIGAGRIAGMANLSVNGGGGADSLVLNDSANPFNGSYQISAATLQGSSNGQQVNVAYQDLTRLVVRTGTGCVNSVSSQLMTGVQQELSGGNSSASTLYVDCQGVMPTVTATQIQGAGFGIILYDGFHTVVLSNVTPPPTPPTPTPLNPPDGVPGSKTGDSLVLRQIEYPNRKFNEADESLLPAKKLRYLLKTDGAEAGTGNNDVEIIIVNEGITVPQ